MPFLNPISSYTSLISSSLIDNKIYLSVNSYGIIHFNDEQPSVEQAIYNSFMVFDENLQPLNLTYNKYTYWMDEHFMTIHGSKINFLSNINTSKMNIIQDENKNTIHFSSNNVYNRSALSKPEKIIFKDGTELDILPGLESGCIFKYDENYELISAITYHRSPTAKRNTRVTVNDAISINNNLCVLLSSENEYYKKNGNNPISIKIFDDGIISDNYTIVKYDEDFSTILWYNKFYSKLNRNLRSWSTTNKHIIKDTKNKYLYSSEYAISSDLWCINNIKNFNIFENETNNTKYIIHKINYTSGEIMFSKIINIINSIPAQSTINKLLYVDDYIYILCNTNGYFEIDDIIYGSSNNTNKKAYLIKMSNLGVVSWVSQLSDDDNCIMTDIISYDGQFGKYIYLTGYYTNYTKIKSHDIKSTGIGSFIAKINILDGSVKNIMTKNSTNTIKIKSIIIKNDSLFISGDFIGSIYIGGNSNKNIKQCEHNEIFLEEIKINTF
jgi:hypothetical protein